MRTRRIRPLACVLPALSLLIMLSAAAANAASRILDVSPDSFTGGLQATVTVTIKNEFAANTLFRVTPHNVSGWTFQPEAYKEVWVNANSTGTITFNLLPPSAGGSATLPWSLQYWDWLNLYNLSDYFQSVTATAQDTTPPTTPGTPDLAAADDTGYSSSDNITKNTSGLTFSWSASSDSGSGVAGYEWKLDSGSWNARSSTSVDISAGSGSHTFYVRAKDNAGNYSAASSLAFTVDTTAPSFPSGLSPSGNQSSQRPTLTWNSASGAHHYHVKVWWDNLGAGYPVLWEGDVTGTSKTLTTDLVWERNYLWAVTSIDAAGNESPNGPPPLANNYTALVAHDTTAPSTPGTPDLAAADDTGSSNTDNITKNTAGLTFSWSASSDSGSGVAGYECKLDSGGWNWVGNVTSTDISAGSGSHTFYVRAKDNAGNYSGSSSLSFTVDTTAPALPSGLSPSGNQGSQRPTLTWNSVSGAHHYHVKVWWDNLGAGYPVLWEGDVTGTSHAMTTDLVWERNYLWAVTSVDTAGNESPNGPPPLANNYTSIIAHDTTGPSTPGTPDLASADDTGSSNTDNITKNTAGLTFSWSPSSDSQSGIAGYEVRIDSSAWSSIGNTTSTDVGAGEGSHTFYVRAKDNAGNYSGSSSLSFTIDTVAPALPSGLSPSGNQGSQRPTLTWNSVSGAHHYHVKVWWDNLGAGYPVLWEGDVTGTSHAMTTDLVWERNYLWAVTAVDTAGNESPNGPPPLANNFTALVAHDSTAPSVPGTPDLAAADDTGSSNTDNITKENNHLAISWTASTDSQSGIQKYQWRLDADPTWWDVGNGTTPSGDLTGGFWGWAVIGDGAHTLYVRAVDNAGNAGNASSLTFTIDTVAPALPSGLSPSGNQGSQRPTLTWNSVSGAHHYHVKVWWDNLGAGYPVLWEGDVTGTSHAMTTDLVWERNYLWAVTAVDTAGNESPNGPPPLANNFTALVAHDSTAPSVPGTPDLAAADDTGSSNTDNITKENNHLAISWTASTDSQSGIQKYQWRLDADPTWWDVGNGTTPSGDLTGGFWGWAVIGDGAHTLYVRAVDNAGNAGNASSLTFTIDTVAPALPSGLSPSGNQGSQRPTLTWNSVSGAHHYHVKVWWDNLGAGYPVLWEGDVTGTSHAMTTDLVWERNYLWAVTAVDTAGNESPNGPPPLANNFTALVAHDSTAPSVPGTPDLAAADDTGSSNTDNITKENNHLAISWTASTDSQSGIQKYQWRLDADPTWWDVGNGTTPSGDLTGGFWGWAVIGDGAHTLYVRAVDNAGNAGNASSLTFTIDTVAPALPSGLSPSGNQGSQRPTLTWNSVSGAHHYHVKVWWDNLGAGYPVLWEGDVTGTSHAMTTDLVWERNYLWAVTAVDTAGNESPNGPPPLANNFTALVAHDSTAPSVPGTPDLAAADDTGSSNTDNITKENNHLAISWTASTDSQSGIQKYQWRLDADPTWWDVGNGTTPSGDLTGGFWGWAVIGDGAHTLYVRAVDNAGNAGNASSLTFTIDTVAPALPSGLSPSGNQGSQRPTLTWNSVSGAHHYHVKVWWDNLGAGYPVLWEGDVTGTSHAMTTDLVWERNYLWAVTAVDTAGNESPNGPPPLANNFTALVAAPKIVVVLPDGGVPIAGVDIYHGPTRIGTTAWDPLVYLLPHSRLIGLNVGDTIDAIAPNIGTGSAVIGEDNIVVVTLNRTTGPTLLCMGPPNGVAMANGTLPIAILATDPSGVVDGTMRLKYWLDDDIGSASEIIPARVPYSPWDTLNIAHALSGVSVASYFGAVQIPVNWNGHTVAVQAYGNNTASLQGQSVISRFAVSGAANLFNNAKYVRVPTDPTPTQITGPAIGGETCLVIQNTSDKAADIYLTIIGPNGYTITPYDVQMFDPDGTPLTQVTSFTVQKGGDIGAKVASLGYNAFRSGTTAGAGAAVGAAIVNVIPGAGQVGYGAAVGGAVAGAVTVSALTDTISPLIWPTSANNWPVGVASICLPNVPANAVRSLRLTNPALGSSWFSDFVVLHSVGGGLIRRGAFDYKYLGGNAGIILPEQNLPSSFGQPGSSFTVEYNPVVNTDQPLAIYIEGPAKAGSSTLGYAVEVRDVTGGDLLVGEETAFALDKSESGYLHKDWLPGMVGKALSTAEKEAIVDAFKIGYAEVLNKAVREAGAQHVWKVYPSDIDVSLQGDLAVVTCTKFFTELAIEGDAVKASVRAGIAGGGTLMKKIVTDQLFEHYPDLYHSWGAKSLLANALGSFIGMGFEFAWRAGEEYLWNSAVGADAVNTRHAFYFWPSATGPRTFRIKLHYVDGSPADAYQQDPRQYVITLSQRPPDVAEWPPAFADAYNGRLVLSAQAGQTTTVSVDVDSNPAATLWFAGAPSGLSVNSTTREITWSPPGGSSPDMHACTLWAKNGIGMEMPLNLEVVVTASADTTAPTIAIASPTAEPSYVTTADFIDLGGTAGDNVGVNAVRWAVSYGETGTAAGTTSWTATGIPLRPGLNTVLVEAEDAAGNKQSDAIEITRAVSVLTTLVQPPGAGTVDANPNQPYYSASDTVQITAQPQTGWRFVNWAGDASGTDSSTLLEMDRDRQATACFEPDYVNGIPWTWLVLHGLPTDGSATFLDTDGDGQLNLNECFAGTDPRSAISCFRIEAVDSPSLTGGVFRVDWSSVAGKRYRVLWSTNLGVPGFSNLATNLPATPPVNSFEDTNAVHGVRFYRIDLEP